MLQMWFHEVFNIICVWEPADSQDFQAWLSTSASTQLKHEKVFV